MNEQMPIRPTYAEVDLDNLSNNLTQLMQLIGDKRFMAVVKADGYGHGAVEVAREALDHGASYLGVAMLEEAVEIRKARIAAPILILGYTPPDHMEMCLKYGIIPTIYTHEGAEALSNAAVRMGKKAFCHVKLDTGMGRIGVTPDQVVDFIKRISELPSIQIEGLFTHFSVADEQDKSYTNKQLEIYLHVLELLKDEQIDIPLKHAANSAATIDVNDAHFDMVRVGLAMYGLYPSPHMRKQVSLKPLMTLKSQVSYIKMVPEGTSISYGRKFITDQESIIATLPIGYADGFSRILSNQAQVLVSGKRVPVVGSICMDQCMFLGDEVPGTKMGDEVVIFGKQGEDEITVEEIADQLGTIHYEVVCMVDKRVPRLYIKNGNVVKTKSLTSNMH